MNLLEQYIEPDWKMRPLTSKEKANYGEVSGLDWVRVDCRVTSYGVTKQGRSTWVRSDWLSAVKQGYYMA